MLPLPMYKSLATRLVSTLWSVILSVNLKFPMELAITTDDPSNASTRARSCQEISTVPTFHVLGTQRTGTRIPYPPQKE
jgi:hypothetical protein